MPSTPAAFMSYVRFNDEHDDGQDQQQPASGVYVYDDGLGNPRRQRNHRQLRAGVEIQSGGNPTLRRNEIHCNQYWAVWVAEGGLGTLEENNVTENGRGAWDIHKGSEDLVTRIGNKE